MRPEGITDEIILESVARIGRRKTVLELGVTTGMVSGVMHRAMLRREGRTDSRREKKEKA